MTAWTALELSHCIRSRRRSRSRSHFTHWRSLANCAVAAAVLAGLANCWFNTVVLLLFGAVIQMSLGRGFGQAWAAAAAAAAAGEEQAAFSIQHTACGMRRKPVACS